MAYDTITIRNAERARRLVILERLLYACAGLVLAMMVLLPALAGDMPTIGRIMVGLGGLLIGIVVAWGLSRAKLLEPAAHVLFVSLIAMTIATSLLEGTRSTTLYTLFLPIVGATLLLRPIWSLGYAALALLTYLSIYLAGPFPATKSVSDFVLYMVIFGGYFGIAALLSYLAAKGYDQLLTSTLEHATELERARDDLELRVEERTADLSLALEQVRRGAETIQQMSVPVVPVADGVLALPLVGALDSQRAGLLTERLLEAIQRERARSVLIDITGVSMVDTQVAAALLRAADAVRMLGAEPVLVGIRAEVAHTIVGLGLDLSHIASRRDLRSGIAYALSDDRRN